MADPSLVARVDDSEPVTARHGVGARGGGARSPLWGSAGSGYPPARSDPCAPVGEALRFSCKAWGLLRKRC
jgi:hypothetical protein